MWISDLLKRAAHETRGSEIVEFAVSLPLLVVLVVAIYDFGTAFTVKHKLSNVVREGARIASSQHHPPDPTAADGSCNAPASICTASNVIGRSLQANIGDDCGFSTASASYSATYTWTFTGSCSGSSLKIERGFINPNAVSLANPFDDSDPYKIENTRVTLVYPYQWQFSKVFQFLTGNANYLSPTMTVSSTMQNLD
ncbi:MAG TPA: TadE/TadG family type IV pilus assembly protein [Terriglobales bacterium]|nr:TadE/TadG family type IV pilus assembly protein [Terriglobales bacterium]